MLRNLNDIREDKSFDLLTEAILQRDQPRTTDLFHQMIVRDGRSIGEALSVVAAAEAPFVNVPCHINMRDGNIVLTNNDHTLLGLRASTYLMPYLPEKYRLLPLMQSVWYIRAGLDIWNQLLGQLSRPLRDDEGHQCAAARLRSGGLARRRRADPREGHARRAAAWLHGRDDDRQFEARRTVCSSVLPKTRRTARHCARRSSFSA